MLKVLIIGCGNIAGGFDAHATAGAAVRTHAGAYAAHGQFAIGACVEPDENIRVAFMKRWRVPDGYASLEQLLAAHTAPKALGRFDVVSICSSTAAHYDNVLQALRLAPKLIFCEKPICSDIAQAQMLLQRCSDQGVLLAVNHNRRWDFDVIRLREELTAGTWGLIRSVAGQYNKGVLNNGSHMIDLVTDLLGPLKLVSCGTPCFDFWDLDPSIPANLVSLAGIPVSLTCGHASDYSLFELQVITQRGIIAMEDGGQSWRTRLHAPSSQFAGYQVLGSSHITVGQYLQTMTNAVANIYRAITTGEPLASTGQTAFNSQLICEAMRSKSRSVDQ